MDTNKFFKYTLSALLIALPLTACSKKEAPKQEISSLIDRAGAYEKNGQYRAAFIELKNALKQDPQNIPAKLKTAALQLKTGQPKSASLVLESIKDAPTNEYVDLYAEALLGQEQFKSTLNFIEKNQAQCSSRCLRLKADALLATDDIANAVKNYEAALQADANNVDAQLGLVKTYYKQKQQEKGSELLEEIIKNHPENTDAFLLKASLLISAGKQAEAEEVLNKALFTLPSTDIITPKRIVIIESLVDILTLQGRTEEALTYSKTLADLDPKGSELRAMMEEAINLYNAKNYEGARKILEKINQESSNSKVKTLLGVIDYMSGNFGQASTLLESGINLESSTPTTKSVLVNSYLITGQTDKALEFLEKDYQTNGNDVDTINLYANTLLRTGNSEKAYPLLEKSLQLKADQTPVHIAKFYYHVQKRDLAAATADITKAYKLSPDDNSVLTLYFGFLARSGKLDQAINELDGMIAKDKDNAYLFYLSGHLHGQKNSPEKTISSYKKSQELDNNLENPSYLALAKFYLLQKDYDAALKSYTDLIDKGLNDAEAYKGIITTYELKKDSDAGLSAVKKIAEEKNSQPARLVLAEYYILNKDGNTAIEYLDTLENSEKTAATKAALVPLILAIPTDASGDSLTKLKRLLVKSISEQPRNTALLYKLIDLELASNNASSAKELNEKLKAIDKSYGPYYYASKIAFLENKPEEAASIAKAGWTALKNDSAGNYYFNFLTGNKLPTGAFIDEWLNAVPDSFNGRLYKALSIQGNDSKAAIKIYEDLLTSYPDSYRVLNNLAWLYQENGDARALETAEKAYQANPNDAAVLDTYGWVLFKNKKTSEALKIFEAAIKIEPNQSEILEHYNTVKAANAK
jgi:tetratricopeptide (TPR) repeat protein